MTGSSRCAGVEAARRIFGAAPVVFDGALGTMLQQRLPGLPCPEAALLGDIDTVAGIHLAYLEAGSDAVETDSFGASEAKLEGFGLAGRQEEICRLAVEAARKAIAEHRAGKAGLPGGRRRDRRITIAASIGPTGFLPSDPSGEPGGPGFDTLEGWFLRQASLLVAAGADVIILETGQDLLEWKAALSGCRRAAALSGRPVPVMVQVTVDRGGRMLLGSSVAAFSAIFSAQAGVDVLGLNCGLGPEAMMEQAARLCRAFSGPVSIMPNAGMPVMEGDRVVYGMEPVPFARKMAQMVGELGVEIVGGCCGTGPAHIAALVEEMASLEPGVRRLQSSVFVSSALDAVDLLAAPKPVLAGERLGTRASRRFRDAFEGDRWDPVLRMAREQMASGARLLDFSPAMEDSAMEEALALKFAHRLSCAVEAPLILDTTNRDLIAKVLRLVAAVPVISSVNLEGGEGPLLEAASMARQSGAALVAACIDEKGMARTAQEKLEVACRLYEILHGKGGLDPGRIIFDPLTFTLASGQEDLRLSAFSTIEGLGLIRRDLPGCMTTLGISNVSHGLGRGLRVILDSVFFHHASRAGLDIAIVNPSAIVPYDALEESKRKPAEDLIFARSPEALSRFVELGGTAAAPRGASRKPGSPAEALRAAILDGTKEGVERLVEEALRGMKPRQLFEEHLLEAMKEVGRLMASGRMILPRVIESASVMGRALQVLEPALGRKEGAAGGRVITATVFGDVHDIGKNIFSSLCRSFGFEVQDLGKQVPAETIAEAASGGGVLAVGLSALLISTARYSGKVAALLRERGILVPVLLGGAAMSRGVALEAATQGSRELLYTAGLFYCKDAFSGLELLGRLADPGLREKAIADENESLSRLTARPGAGTAPPGAQPVAPIPDRPIAAPGPGADRPARRADLEIVRFAAPDLKSRMSLTHLFVKGWGVRLRQLKNDADLSQDLLARFERIWEPIIEERLIDTAAVCGTFEAQRQGDGIVVEHGGRRFTFAFPARGAGKKVSITDMVFGKQARRPEVSFFVSTIGPFIVEEIVRRRRGGGDEEALLLHSVAAEAAEALAELVHGHIERARGAREGSSRRFSPGYPLFPDLKGQAAIFGLLRPERIGVTLTAGFQMVPEYSVSAIIVY